MKNKKSLGQHWLQDRAILDAIAALAAESEAELCLEIGPGLGTLTSALLRRFLRVVAVEYDQTLAANLPKSFPGKNLTVIQQDFLQYDYRDITSPYVVAGNIPYYITSPIIQKILTTKPLPERVVLLIQKEVAERILAQDGHSMLSLTVQNLAMVEPGFVVSKSYFTPPPKVDSATIVLIPRTKPVVSDAALALAAVGFKNPRKKLLNNLPYSAADLQPIFTRLQLSPNIRPAELSLEDWQKLSDSLKNHLSK